MKKVIRLSEKDLTQIVSKVIKEQQEMRLEPSEFSEIKMKVQDFQNNINLNDQEKWQKTMSFLMEENPTAYNILKSIGSRGEASIKGLIDILAAMNAIYKDDMF